MIRLSSPIALGLVLAGAAAPALAHDVPSAPNHQTMHYDARTQRFCAARTVTGADTITGSMLSRRVCRTREQWAAMGVVFPHG